MSVLTQQELTGLDPVIKPGKSLADPVNDVNNLTSSFVTPTNNSSILQVDVNSGLTGGEGLSVSELMKLREDSFK